MVIRRSQARILAVAIIAFMAIGAAFSETAGAAGENAPAAEATGDPAQGQELARIRDRILTIEGDLSEGLRARRRARSNLRGLRELVALRRRERELCKGRLQELEDTVHGLEERRETLDGQIKLQQLSVRKFLIAVELSTRHEGRHQGSPEDPPEGMTDALTRIRSIHLPEEEKLEAPRRRLLANLAGHGLKELEILRADLDDAANLRAKIEDEKLQLAYLLQDLDEKESVLELDQRIQADYFGKSREGRVAQLESYRRLKSSEGEVEQLIRDFNARLELERSNEAERAMSRLMTEGSFAATKGKLRLPVADGKVISGYGRAFDPRSRLYIFKKGIDILAGKDEPVRAVFPGKIAFSGELPDYGQVTIIDHGDHYYSLCAHLGRVTRREGDAVAAGDPIGVTDGIGTPIYFEIRTRNVPVNPLQWLSNSISLE